MNVSISEIMTEQVMTARQNQTVHQVKEVMNKHGVSCMRVSSSDGEPVGIITSTDILAVRRESTPIRDVMSTKVLTVPQYSSPAEAARIMRNHQVHHLVVTHEKQIVGLISSFDLLQLVENHRFVMKNPSTPTRPRGKRKKNEEH